MTEEAAGDLTDGDDEAYGGVLGAFPYAFRASDSRLFRVYVVCGGLLAAAVAVLFALALVVLLGSTFSSPGGTFTFSRAFFIVVGLLVVGPLITPVLLVARRRRRASSSRRYDAALAACGYLFVASLYVALVISTPASQQQAATGGLAPVVEALYALPRTAGAGPPLSIVALMAGVHRWLS
jgi:hypothetical protein